ARQEESVLAAAHAVGAERGTPLRHGTTIATNALLERKGARTAFVTTAGFEHLLHLRRQSRASLYRLCADHPPPLVPLERCHGVEERMGPDGVIAPLRTIPEVDAEAIAVCLLFSFRVPSHELAVADVLRRRTPRAHVLASSEADPEVDDDECATATLAGSHVSALAARNPSGL